MGQAQVSYLAYGSNMHPQRLAVRIGPPLAAHAIRLSDWALRFHKRSQDGSGKCDIVPDPGHVVHGVVYTLSHESKEKLDAIEGAGFGYQLAELIIPGKGSVSTYRAQADAIDASLQPYDWYLQLVIAGARHHRLPEEYLAELVRIPSLDDQDESRRTRMARILSPR